MDQVEELHWRRLWDELYRVLAGRSEQDIDFFCVHGCLPQRPGAASAQAFDLARAPIVSWTQHQCETARRSLDEKTFFLQHGRWPDTENRIRTGERANTPTSLEVRLRCRIELERWRKRQALQNVQIRGTISHPYHWVTCHTQTFNPHWQDEGRPSPYEFFPKNKPHIKALFDLLLNMERILLIEKSRDLMISWICVAFFTWQAMTTPERRVLFQTQKKDKVIELIDYAKCLYRRQSPQLQQAFPLTRSLNDQGALKLEFMTGGGIFGLPGGADKIRLYHPWGYFNDESAFQPEAGECYDECLSVVSGKIVFNSSAGPGWDADFKRDITRTAEDD